MKTFHTNRRNYLFRISGLAIILAMLYSFSGNGLVNAVNIGAYFQQIQEYSYLAELNVTQRDDQMPRVTIHVENMQLVEILHKFADELGVDISINTQKIKKKKITYQARDKFIYDVLLDLLENTGLEVQLSQDRKVLIIQEIEETEAQNIFQETINGSVTDAQTGEALPGVNVVVEGTAIGTTTGTEGTFELEVPGLQETLIFTFIGYERMEVPLEGRTEMNIELVSEIITGEELVVVGYGMVQRRDLTGSVSSIDRRDVVAEPVYSMENLLQGRAAGVEVTADGYRPGEGATIRIRGTRSLEASNDPLFVIDGVPLEGGSLMDLNPREVESIEILKDASATAIYGSRGANGVILVTTRRGAENIGVEVEYSGFAGVQHTGSRINVMDTQQFAEFKRDAHRRAGTYTSDEDIFAPWELEAIAENRTTDWQDLVMDTNVQQQHTLSVRGGGNGTRYALSGTIDDHDAIIVNNDFKRYSARLNLDQQVFPWLQMGISSSLNTSTQHVSGGLDRVVANFPMSSPFDADERPVMYDENGDRNPLFNMQRENKLDRRQRTRIISNAYAVVDFSENFTMRTNFSPDFSFRNDGFYTRDIPWSEAGTRDDRETTWLFEAILDYDNTFYDVHRLSVTSLFSLQNYELQSRRLEVSDLPFEQQLFHNLDSAANVEHRSSRLSEWTLESYMLRANYVYDDRYLLTVTGRVDGSSRLATGNEYGLFPSMAVAWHLGNEAFLSDIDVLSELKLRFSVGDVGNTAIAPYQTQGVLATDHMTWGDETIFTFLHGDIPNPDLQWERTRTFDLGLDFAFLDHRFSGNIDLYQSDTYDLLMARLLPTTSGFESALENIGQVRNQGLEISLSSVNVHTSEFIWSTDLNFATNRNEIVDLFGDKQDDPGSGWFIGESLNANYFWDRIGVWQIDEAEEAASYGFEPGDIKFRDVTGDGRIGGDDRVILGSPDPKWTAGITNRLSYRNFDFSVIAYTAYGRRSSGEDAHIASATFDGLLSFRPTASNNLDVDYWMPDNPTNKWPGPRLEAEAFRGAFAYGMDTSYFRVRNITLGYTLPAELQSRLGARNARIYASVQNPLTITDPDFIGFDPEGATQRQQMPNYQTYLLGIELSF